MSETLKAHQRRVKDGFYERYCSGKVILDIGCAGTGGETFPDMNVVGLDKDTPGYDGVHIPYPDDYFDVVYSSHTLEHFKDDVFQLKEQFRVTKPGGYTIIYVPHQYLYEKKENLPSRFNLEHFHFYTPGKLLQKIETALKPNTYRLRLLKDCDEGFDYLIPPEKHSVGEYAIECVIQKL